MIHLLQFFFAPAGQPWYAGAVWGNVAAIIPCGLLGWLWSKTKFWPLNLIEGKIRALHTKNDALLASHVELHRRLDELHEKHDRLEQHVLASGPGSETSNLACGGSTPS